MLIFNWQPCGCAADGLPPSSRSRIAGDAAHLFTPTGGMGYNTSVDDAVNYILDEVEKKSLIIVFPQTARDAYALYRTDRQEFDRQIAKLAAERRENYRTKGTYF